MQPISCVICVFNSWLVFIYLNKMYCCFSSTLVFNAHFNEKHKQNKEALKELVYFQGRGQQLLEMLALEASCGAEVLVLCRAAPVWRRLWSKDKCIVFVFGHTWLQTKTHSSQGQWIRVGVAVLEVLGFSELMKQLQFIVIDLIKLYLCVSWCE